MSEWGACVRRRCVPPALRNSFTAATPRPSDRRWKWLSKTATAVSPQESRRLQLARDALHRVLDVLGLARPRAYELPAPEQQDDHLGLVDAVHQAGELLRLILHLLQAEGERDRVQVDLRPQVAGGDDVLHVDDGVLLDLDPRGLDLLRNGVDRRAHVLQALRARADDLPAAEQQRRRLRLLEAVDQAGELLRLVLRPAQGQGDRLQVQLVAERGRGHHVLNLDLRHGQSSLTRASGPPESALGYISRL